jgi:hypothetical protein
VRADPVSALERREVEANNSAVRAAGDEGVTDKLELADERGVALKEGDAVAGRVSTSSNIQKSRLTPSRQTRFAPKRPNSP